MQKKVSRVCILQHLKVEQSNQKLQNTFLDRNASEARLDFNQTDINMGARLPAPTLCPTK